MRACVGWVGMRGFGKGSTCEDKRERERYHQTAQHFSGIRASLTRETDMGRTCYGGLGSRGHMDWTVVGRRGAGGFMGRISFTQFSPFYGEGASLAWVAPFHFSLIGGVFS